MLLLLLLLLLMVLLCLLLQEICPHLLLEGLKLRSLSVERTIIIETLHHHHLMLERQIILVRVRFGVSSLLLLLQLKL